MRMAYYRYKVFACLAWCGFLLFTPNIGVGAELRNQELEDLQISVGDFDSRAAGSKIEDSGKAREDSAHAIHEPHERNRLKPSAAALQQCVQPPFPLAETSVNNKTAAVSAPAASPRSTPASKPVPAPLPGSLQAEELGIDKGANTTPSGRSQHEDLMVMAGDPGHAEHAALGVTPRPGIFASSASAFPAAMWSRKTRLVARVPRASAEEFGAGSAISELPGMDATAGAILRSAVSGSRTIGAATLLKDKKMVDIDLGDVNTNTSQRNLAIKIAEESQVQAKSNTLSVRSAFRPVFGAAVTYTNTDTYPRREYIVRDRFDGQKLEEQFMAFEEAFESEKVVDPVIGIITIDGERVESAGSAIYPFTVKGDWDQASWRTQNDSWSIALGMNQYIPWGSSLGITMTSTHKNPENPEGINYGLFHHANWSASLAASLSVPLPFGKGFGPYAANDWSLRDSEMYEEQARENTRSVKNSNLAAAQIAYWNLVGAAERLRITRISRMLTEKLVTQVRKLVEAERATPYSLSQIKAQLEQTRYAEELAYQNYVVSTNNLKQILNIPEQVIFVPKNYKQALEKSMDVNVEQALQQALDNNPTLNASRIALKRKQHEYKYSRNQARPDFYLYGMLSFSQDTSEFGYSTLTDALDNIIPGDKEDHYVGIAFSIPWGNNPARARLEQTREDLRITSDNFERTQNQVQEQTKNALAALLSARGQVKAAARRRDLADEALRGAQKLAAAGRITQFETIGKINDALNADLAWIDAVVSRKIAEVQLLSAQGLLPTAAAK